VETKGFLKYECWFSPLRDASLTGTAVSVLVSDPHYLSNTPDMISYTAGFTTRPVFPDDSHEEYGARITGWITPTVTGDYNFFLASDDASELWISTDSMEANLQQVAVESGCCHGFLEVGNPQTTVTPLSLVAGQKYAVKILLKEGGGGDYVQVAMQAANGTIPAWSLKPLVSTMLSSMADPAGASLTITQQPVDIPTPENAPVTFTIAATATTPYGQYTGGGSPVLGGAAPLGTKNQLPTFYQWFTNGIEVPGANDTSYTIPSPKQADNGTKVKCYVAVPGIPLFSSEVTLTVTADTTPLTVVKASSDIAFDNVVVQFSEPVSDTALAASSYVIDQSVTVSSVSRIDLTSVKLTTSQLPEGMRFTLTINGVQDTAYTPNTMAPNTTVQFNTLVFVPGMVLRQKYMGFDDGAGFNNDNLFNDPRYPNAPDRQDLVRRWEYPPDGIGRIGSEVPPKNFMDTIDGFFIPATTGNYVFFTAGADRWTLFLSTDESSANKHMIAQESGWTDPRMWNTGHNTDMTQARSDQYGGTQWTTGHTITLTAGKRYYMQAIHFDPSWCGADDFAVTFKLEGEPDPADGDAPRLTGSLIGCYLDRIAGSPVTLVNPSFEADTFTVWPGYAGAGNGAIMGWSGGGGVNPVSGLNPFTDNGQVPDRNQVAFIQGAGSLSQTIGGFTVAAPYDLRYRENARNSSGGALPSMKATMDGFEIVDDHTVTPVGGANPYHVVTSAKFLAAHTDQVLSFVASSPGGGDSTALIDFVEVVPVAGPFVRSYAPVGGDLPTDSQISIVLEDGLTEVDPSSIQLTLDGTVMSPAISKSGDLTTVQFSPPSWFIPISHHVVNLTYGDDSPSPTLAVHAFSFDAGAFSTTPGAFFIEAEDFNFGSGQHQASADAMPYYGGAYNGLSAVQGVDYFVVPPGAPASADVYRTGEDPNVGIVGNTDSNRGSFDVAANYELGWSTTGNWFNYTRSFPAGSYNIYARLSSGYANESGWADEHAQLDLVSSGATTPNQSLVKLGSFDAPATRAWGIYGFVPLKTDSGQLAAVNLRGEQTLRFTVLPPGALDCNYLMLVPAAAPSGPAPALLSVIAFNGNNIIATFDQMLDPSSVLDISHYAIAGASVTSAILSADAKTVLLTVSGLSGGGVTLTVNGVVGASGLSVPPGTSLAGTVSPLTPLDIAPAASGAAVGSLSPQSAQDFDVIAGGNNIGGNQDGFHFDYQQWSGDFDAVVHVTRLDNSGAYAIAGLMIRQNTTPGSPQASVGLEPSLGNNNNRVQLRALQDGPTTDWGFNSAASTQPWLRLKRLGNELFAYRSPDGVSWTKLGQTTQAFTDPVLVGLATSPGSFAPGATTVANYRGYMLSANPAPILQIAAVDAYASRAGADPGLFKLSLFGQRAAPVTIPYAISGSAANGVDYEPIPNSMTIPAGQPSVYIAIKPAPGDSAQGFKNVTLTLLPATGVETELASATVGLFDDQPQSGYLMREVYRNLSLNGPVADLTSAPAFPNSPNQADLVSSIESPTVAEGTLGVGYGQRLSGYLIPPTDGNYTFYICSDDSSELWLSTDENPAHEVLIASEPQWNPARQWTGAYNQASRGTPPSNVSAPIPLLGAQRYYIEILHKQGGGGDDLAVAWQKPGDPQPINGSDPIGSAYLEVRVPLSISGLTPAGVQSGGGDFNLVVNGAGFVSGATLLWNGTARATTVSGPRQLTAVIPASDIVAGAELWTAMVTVQNPGGEISNPLAFTIGTAAMSVADSAFVPAGGTVLVSTAPSDASSPGVQAGVSAAFNHADGVGPATISAVTYSSNPAAGTLFDTGAGFVDIQVAGAQPNDSMAANFYYPSSITSPVEDTLVLLYFNGTVWGPVLSSGGASPAKDTTDNLDGTVSGGRFSVVFDNTSTPPITGLGGTVFAPTTPAIALDKTPPVPDAESLSDITGQCSATISTVPTATDAVTGKVKGTTTNPLTYTDQGTYTVTWHYNDGNGNVSSQTQRVTVKDTMPPQIACPANLTVPCNINLLEPVTFMVTATDNCDPAPVVTCTPASGSGFAVGTSTVKCTASDASGNQSTSSFSVTRAPLSFTGFLSPIAGADTTGGTSDSPVRTFKAGSTIPVKFTAACGGSPVLTGIHRLQVVHYADSTTSGTPIDTTPQGSATVGDQFRLSDGQWIFNLDTKATGMSTGIWLLRTTLSDGSQHSVWIQLK
jgi:hypothetical protein